jgi:VWFA-related protein
MRYWEFSAGILLVSALALGGWAAQQSAPPKQQAEEPPVPLIRTRVDVVIAPTSVLDKDDRPISGIKQTEFRLYDNNKLQDINEDIAFQPMSMVIVIQRSSNVEAILPKVQKMGTIMRDLLVGADGEAAVMTFDHRIVVEQEFTNDGEKINAALAKLKPGGQNSRLNDAVYQATRMLRAKKDRRKIIVLISETLDRSSEIHPREVATELQIHNVEVVTLNISRILTSLTAKPALPRTNNMPVATRRLPNGASMDPTTVAQYTGAPGQSADFVPVIVEMFRAVKAIFISNPAEIYTRYTGGAEYSFMSQGDLERAIARIGEDLRSQYLLSYNPNNKDEGGFHEIRVEVLRPGVQVRTRRGYWAAAQY